MSKTVTMLHLSFIEKRLQSCLELWDIKIEHVHNLLACSNLNLGKYYGVNIFKKYVNMKTRREDEGCDFCLSWIGLPTKRVPQPVADPQRPSHNMHVSRIPLPT